ncbi:MAG: carboxypeptidase regulatory-like domain-containing protein [Gemmatimonadales bacterium]
MFAALLVALAARGAAQDPRNQLRLGIQAYNLAEYQLALTHLTDGLVPTAVTRDEIWEGGLFALGHILIEGRKDSLAALWLRWGLRQKPDLALDTLAFPPSVLEAYVLARARVADPPAGSRDVDVETVWSWNDPRSTTHGAIRFDVAAGVQLSLFVDGVGVLKPGELRTLPAGTYTILASAPGYFRTRLTREVLPGSTVGLRFQLRRTVAQARGFLYVTAKPWGAISLNGRPIGYTPVWELPVDVGTHKIRIERLGYQPFETTVTVARDERVRLEAIQLTPTGGPR